MRHKFNAGANKVIQNETTQNDKEQARLAAQNSGLEFGGPQNAERREIIEMDDDNDDNIIDIVPITNQMISSIKRHRSSQT